MSNNTDSRSVHTDALATLGTIIDDTQKRDAIHLAVIPMQAKGRMKPGSHIDADGDLCTRGVGIVDPFLTASVEKGQWFWCVIYPRVITSLRHVWSHPAFEEEQPPKPDHSSSEARLRELADRVGISYGRLMDGADEWILSRKRSEYGEYIIGGYEMEGESVPDWFWPLYEEIRGVKVDEAHRGSFFSCSC